MSANGLHRIRWSRAAVARVHRTAARQFVGDIVEGLNGVNRQPSNGPKINRQRSKTEYFYRQPLNERAKISR